MKEKIVPRIILEVGFDFNWSSQKVWKLNYPVEEIDIKKLEWHFEIPFWNTPNGVYDLKPREVIKAPKKFSQEYERAMKADLRHPIDIMKNKGRWLILDGLPRLVKSKLLGHNKVKVRKIPTSEIHSISK